MSFLNNLNLDWKRKLDEKAAKENLRPLLEETISTLHASHEPFIFVKLNDDGSFVTASGGDTQTNMVKVYFNALGFFIASLKVNGVSDKQISESLHSAIDECIKIINSDPDGLQKWYGLKKIKR